MRRRAIANTSYVMLTTYCIVLAACSRSQPSPNVEVPPGSSSGTMQGPSSSPARISEHSIAEGPLKLSSHSFEPGGSIPKIHTCQGEDRSPPLAFADIPENAKSLALIVDDPDAPDPKAPKRTWVHWVLYDLPVETKELAAGIKTLQAGTREGRNDWKRTGYGGPCPPIGRHRYVHQLYALDVMLPDLGQPTKTQLEAAMSGHILAKAELVGTYQKE